MGAGGSVGVSASSGCSVCGSGAKSVGLAAGSPAYEGESWTSGGGRRGKRGSCGRPSWALARGSGERAWALEGWSRDWKGA